MPVMRRAQRSIDWNLPNRVAAARTPKASAIATAMTGDFTVVTHEKKDGPGSKKVKIPAICEEFEVPYLSIFELMRIKRVELHL